MGFMDMTGFEAAIEQDTPIENIGSVLSEGFEALMNPATAPNVNPQDQLAHDTPSSGQAPYVSPSGNKVVGVSTLKLS